MNASEVMTIATPLLSVDGLAIDVMRGALANPLVRDASWSISRSETLAIVGESGSGKSLSALAALGLLAPELRVTRGTIHFEGRDLVQLDERAMREVRGSKVSMIFQEPMTSLNPVKSIGHQLTEGMRLKLGLSKRDAETRAVSLLKEVGVSDAERRLVQYPHQLSGGMRQRVMIAIALACEPELILADEPTTALDVTIQAQILALTARLCAEHGVGLVLITHNLGIVARHASRVVVMYGGRVVEEGVAADLYRAPLHPYTAGLLASVPRLDTPRDAPLRPVPGSPPDPFDVIEGCRFHPRCARASERCVAQVPPLEALPGTARPVACFHPLGADAVEVAA